MALIRLLALEDRISPLILRLVLMPVVLGALVMPSSAYAQASLQHVVLTYSSRSIASIDLYVAQERGFFHEEGLDAQLVQVRATAAIAAIVSGEVHALGSIGSAIRAIPRGAPIKVLAVSLRRPGFWLVSRPELKSFNDLKGKVMGTTTIGGSQHTAGVRLLRQAGLNPDKDFDGGFRRRCADTAPGVGEWFDSGRHSFTAHRDCRAR